MNQERFEDASEDENEDGRETVHDVFTRAFQGNILQQNPEQLIPVVLARAGYERRKIESGRADEDSLATLISILESGIEIVLQGQFYQYPCIQVDQLIVSSN